MRSLSRRHFVRHTTTALAAIALGARAQAAPPGFNLGFSLYGMKTVPLAEALRTCARIGYQNVELALNPGYPTESASFSPEQRAALREELASLHLNVSGLMLNLSLAVSDAIHAQHLDSLKSAAQLGHDVTPGRTTLVETVLGGKAAEWDTIKDKMAERLHGWSEVAAKNDLVIALKAHVMSAVNTPERLLWLLETVKSPAIQAVYDYSHFELAGLSLSETLKALLPHTRFIHVKDTTGTSEKFQFLLPGEGRTDYAAYFKLLTELGYAGPVVVEVSAQVFNKPGYDPIAAAESSYKRLHAALLQ